MNGSCDLELIRSILSFPEAAVFFQSILLVSWNSTYEQTNIHTYIYRVIQEESALLWEMIVWVILSKKVHTNMGPILNGYGVMTAWNLE